jgi:lipoate-protein ligase A
VFWERLLGRVFYKNIHRGVHPGLKAVGTEHLVAARRGKTAVATHCLTAPEPMDLVDDAGTKALGGALRRRAGRGLYQGSLRPEVFGRRAGELEDAVRAGLSEEFGRKPETALRPAWLAEGRRLTAKYESDRWNKRR